MLLLMSFCCFSNLSAQYKRTDSTQLIIKINDFVKNIDRQILGINQNPQFKVVVLNNEDFLDSSFIKQPGKGSGKLTGYFINSSICKIREYIAINLLHDRATTEYYFSDGKLIFVNETEDYGPDIIIDSSGTVDHKKNKSDFEGKYYFDNDKIIKSYKKGQQHIIPNEMYFDSQSKDGQLILSAQKYMGLLTDKIKQ